MKGAENEDEKAHNKKGTKGRIRLAVHKTQEKLTQNPLNVVRKYLDNAYEAEQEGGGKAQDRRDAQGKAQGKLPALKEWSRDAVTHPQEKLALEAITCILGTNLQPFQHYLEENGAELGTGRTPELRRFGAQLWKDMAKRALQQATEEKATLTPLLAKLLNNAQDTLDALKVTQRDKDKAIRDPRLGEGLDEALKDVQRWAKDASADELKRVAKRAGGVVTRAAAKTSPLLADPATLHQIAPLIEDHLADALDNPNLTKESTTALLDAALLSAYGLDYYSKRAEKLAFWQKAAEKGVKLDDRQVNMALTLAQRCTTLNAQAAFYINDGRGLSPSGGPCERRRCLSRQSHHNKWKKPVSCHYGISHRRSRLAATIQSCLEDLHSLQKRSCPDVGRHGGKTLPHTAATPQVAR